jgi:hypothetical protein
MKKILVLIAVFVLAAALVGSMSSCKQRSPAPSDTNTPGPIVFDDFSGTAGQTDGSKFGGYWYTYDDLVNHNGASAVNCGDSQVVPMSANANARFNYGATPLPTFVIIVPDVTPTGTNYGFALRVSGNVDRLSTQGYQYGFAGFGANLLGTNLDGSKNPIDAISLNYNRLQFWYRDGPTAGIHPANNWKVSLGNSYTPTGAACSMTVNDNVPVFNFTTTTTWQKFDHAFTEFAPEGWGSPITAACPARGAKTSCSIDTTVPPADAYDGGAQFSCTAPQALTALNALQWQTNFSTATNANPFDIEIAGITISQ